MENPDNELPMLYAKGSNYEVGYSVGCTFSRRIKMYINECKDTQQISIPFYDSPKGRDICDITLRRTSENFPQYMEEMKGTALGAGLPFERIFLLNMERDIVNGHARVLQENTGCSTVVVNTPDAKLVGHNEDGNPSVREYGYLLNLAITTEGEEAKEHFAGMCYPGALPGNTISINHHGLVTAMDNVQVKEAPVTTPSHVLLRAMMAAKDVNEVVAILSNKGFGCAGGLAVIVRSLSALDDVWVIELCPCETKSCCHVTKIEESSYIHVNTFKHRKGNELLPKVSSEMRLKRARELPTPRSVKDVRNILGDTENKDYPFFRRENATDDAVTFSTGIIDMMSKEFQFYRGNPKTSPPLVCMPLTLY